MDRIHILTLNPVNTKLKRIMQKLTYYSFQHFQNNLPIIPSLFPYTIPNILIEFFSFSWKYAQTQKGFTCMTLLMCNTHAFYAYVTGFWKISLNVTIDT